MQPTADGGYIVAGSTNSFGAGGVDAWVLKLDGSGNVLWQKTYGGGGTDYANAVQPTADGGYIVAGYTTSFGAGMGDAWVLKLDASGNVLWQKTYGGTGDDGAYSVQPTGDGGYVVAGYTFSFGAGVGDVWVLKLDASGNVIWQKIYGGTRDDLAYSVQPTADGGYVVAGETNLLPWVLKLDAAGNVIWQKTYGGSGGAAYSVQPSADGSYIVAGFNQSGAFVLKLDANGGITWQHQYGGTFGSALSVHSTGDGGYIVAGFIYEQKAMMARVPSASVLKVDSNGSITNCDKMRASNLTAADTNVTVGNSTATPAASLAMPVSSTATTLNSSATPLQQCFYDMATVTSVPTLSEWGMFLISGILGLCGAMVLCRDQKDKR